MTDDDVQPQLRVRRQRQGCCVCGISWLLSGELFRLSGVLDTLSPKHLLPVDVLSLVPALIRRKACQY